jgi:hypothetical protein
MKEVFNADCTKEGLVEEPTKSSSSIVLTEDDYTDRVRLLYKWNTMPANTENERSARLAFKQSHRQGYRLDRLYSVANLDGSRVLKRRADKEAAINDKPWAIKDRWVCHASSIFDVIDRFHKPRHSQSDVLAETIRYSWSNVPRKHIDIYISLCPECIINAKINGDIGSTKRKRSVKSHLQYN